MTATQPTINPKEVKEQVLKILLNFISNAEMRATKGKYPIPMKKAAAIERLRIYIDHYKNTTTDQLFTLILDMEPDMRTLISSPESRYHAGDMVKVKAIIETVRGYLLDRVNTNQFGK